MAPPVLPPVFPPVVPLLVPPVAGGHRSKLIPQVETKSLMGPIGLLAQQPNCMQEY